MYPQNSIGVNFDPNSYNAQLAAIQRQINSMSYQPAVQAQPQTQLLQNTQQVAHVSGLEGAKVYQKTLGPESSVVVLDNDEDTMYMLSTDANGNPKPIAICRYTVETEASQSNNFVTKQDFDEFKNELKELLKGAMNEQPA